MRRFNFFGYADGQEYENQGAPVVAAQHNPEVTVRARGVMEKCTYCVQRISAARRTAEKENRPIAEGEVVTACQSACPTRAIRFGDLNRAGFRALPPAAGAASLRAARPSRHPAAHHLPQARAQPEPGAGGGRMSAPTLPPAASYAEMIGVVADPVLERRAGRRWWTGFGIALLLTLGFVGCLAWLFIAGIGIWGVNTPVVWGFAIANFVWWLGIGHAGTLISALLLITRQSWRASINRFAEAMTLFAATIAGLFPIMHLGRPYRFYWLLPYPNSMELWPQWRSALVWDFAAISTYIIFSILFWYWGLIPDLATMRDRAHGRLARRLYGIFALGWRGSARHWQRMTCSTAPWPALAVPLVVSVHSVVGMDFAASLMPGWQETIFPPYFVIGAHVLRLRHGGDAGRAAAPGPRAAGGDHRAAFRRHGQDRARRSVAMGISYLTEWFTAWYGGERIEQEHLRYLFTGDYAPLYCLMLACNVLVPQLLWSGRLRRHILAAFVVSIVINIGMWLERILIIWNTLSHAHLPSMRHVFIPTFWDWATLGCSIGVFGFLFFCFVRLLPSVAMHDLNKRLHEEKAARA